MIRTFKFKLMANKRQRATLESWRHCCHELYNAALQERRDAWQKQKISVSWVDQCKQLTQIRAADPMIALVPVRTQQQVFRRLDKTFQGFFRRVKTGEKPGFPRFRALDRYESISLGQDARLDSDRVVVPKIGPIRFHKHRDVVGKILETILKLTSRGWYVFFQCDVGETPSKVPVRNAIGVDLGLAHFLTFSDGSSVENPRYFRRGEEVLARRQRSLSRKKRGSNSRRKAKLLVARSYEHVRNQRLDFSWKLANAIVSKYDLIAHEDLQIKSMLQSSFSKFISDVSWGRFLHCLSCKAEEAGKTVVAVDPRGTSQRCSGCDRTVSKALSERRHRCPCGVDLHRDHNAALNVLALGLSAVET